MKDANHHPVTVINGDSEPQAMILNAEARNQLELDASKLYDPDNVKEINTREETICYGSVSRHRPTNTL